MGRGGYTGKGSGQGKFKAAACGIAFRRAAGPNAGVSTPSRAHFPTTHWSVVVAARDDDARPALENLCRIYWPPLYAELRRRGHSPADAQDATQEFFARLLRHHSFGAADRQRGRFRTFLLAALDHFLTDRWREQHAQKRGGGEAALSLDAAEGEACFEQAAPQLDPAAAFDQRWALILMDRALAALREEYAATGRAHIADSVQPFLAAETGGDGYDDICAQHGMSAETFTVAVHRFRKRFRACLRAQVENTVADPAETDGEMRHLFGI